MADFEFADGREITFDLSKISIGEYKALFDPNQSDETYATNNNLTGNKIPVITPNTIKDSRKLLLFINKIWKSMIWEIASLVWTASQVYSIYRSEIKLHSLWP